MRWMETTNATQTDIQAPPGGGPSSARESSTALRSAAPKVTTRFKKRGDIDLMVYEFLPLVPALTTNHEQRMLVASLAVAEARKTGSTDRTPEGAARAFLDKLAEVMGAQDGFQEGF